MQPSLSYALPGQKATTSTVYNAENLTSRRKRSVWRGEKSQTIEKKEKMLNAEARAEHRAAENLPRRPGHTNKNAHHCSNHDVE